MQAGSRATSSISLDYEQDAPLTLQPAIVATVVATARPVVHFERLQVDLWIHSTYKATSVRWGRSLPFGESSPWGYNTITEPACHCSHILLFSCYTLQQVSMKSMCVTWCYSFDHVAPMTSPKQCPDYVHIKTIREGHSEEQFLVALCMLHSIAVCLCPCCIDAAMFLWRAPQ